jgi:hypothetical protein
MNEPTINIDDREAALASLRKLAAPHWAGIDNPTTYTQSLRNNETLAGVATEALNRLEKAAARIRVLEAECLAGRRRLNEVGSDRQNEDYYESKAAYRDARAATGEIPPKDQRICERAASGQFALCDPETAREIGGAP